MKLRLLPAALATTLLATALLVASPADAVPAAPELTFGTNTPGHVTGTVSSDQPFVFVWLHDEGQQKPRTRIDMAEGNSFDLETWGLGRFDQVALFAAACPTGTYVEADCGWTYDHFTPSDLAPEVTWFADATIGKNDPDPVIDIADPGGNGTFLLYHLGGDGLLRGEFDLTEGANELDVADGLNGVVRLARCSTDRTSCKQFSPDLSHPLSVLRNPAVTTATPIKTIYTDRNSSFQLAGGPPGEAEVTWHVERVSVPGVPVTTDQTSAVSVDSAGLFEEIALSREGLIPRVNGYVVVGHVSLDSPDYGQFNDVAFTSTPFTVSSSAAVTWTANFSVIYPNVNTSAYPGKVTWSVKGVGYESLSKVQVWSSTNEVITGLGVSSGSSTTAAIQWNGKAPDGKSAPSGYYKLMLWDSAGDPINVKPIIRVDARRMVTKTWTKTVSAAGSVKDQYVGRCSTLRKPAGRGWTYSLGYWANTKCSTTGSTASLVSTVNAVTLPKIAGNYASVRVSLYGGAATSRTGSRGVIRYLTNSGKWTSETVVTAPLTHHSGVQRTASGMVFSDRTFAWGFYTLNGHRYDVKSFTVVVRYNVLG